MSESIFAEQEAPVLDDKPSTVSETENTVNKAEGKADAPRPKNSSYYYWHGHEKERAKVGDVAPMPTPVLVSREDMTEKPSSVQLPKTVKKYQWCDEDSKRLSVYVQVADEEGEELVDGSVEVEILAKSLRVSFSTKIAPSAARNCKQLHLFLAKKVNPSASSYRIKSSKQEICLKLLKAQDGTWFDLVGTPVSDTDDDQDVEDDLPENKTNNADGEDISNSAE